MMHTKSSSTGKSKVKRSQLTRMTEYSTCSKALPDSVYKKDYERPQPVRIGQLLKQAELLRSAHKSAHKDTVHKRIQPERLGASIKKSGGNKENETNQFVQPGKSVRRILNFNEPSNNTKDKCENRDQASKFDECTNKNITKPGRKSCILPPNTIRENHFKKCTNDVHRYSSIAKVSNVTDHTYGQSSIREKTDSVNESSNTNINSVKLRNGRSINRESKIVNNTNDRQRFTALNRSKALISQREDLPRVTMKDELTTENSERSKIYVERKELGGSVQNLSKDLSEVPNVGPETLISQREDLLQMTNSRTESITENSERSKVHVERKELGGSVQNLSKDLSEVPNVGPETLISQREDLQMTNSRIELITENSERIKQPKETVGSIRDLCKDLQNTKLVTDEDDTRMEDGSSNMICIERDKLISLQHSLENLMCIVRSILLLNDEAPELPDTKLRKVPKIVVDKEVQVEICEVICPKERLETSKNVPLNEIENLIETDDENKENKHFDVMRLSDTTTNSSFLELENELNIVHAEPTRDNVSRLNTPVIKRYKQKSFREYMALKSSISFLETPDGQRFRSLCQIDNVGRPDPNRTSISKKLLETIFALNSESPGSDL